MDWVKEIKENEDKALKLLYKTYRDDVILWLERKYSIDTESGADIFQQAIILFYDKIVQNKLSDETANVKTYIFGICKFKALNFIKKNKKEISFKQNYAKSLRESSEFDESAYKEYLSKVLKEILDKIGNPCKKILELYYYKMYSIEKICDFLGYKNLNTTKNQKYKCIKRLQLMVLDIYRQNE